MIRKYAEIFCWKNVSSFRSAKAIHIFSAKNIRILCIESTKTVNEMTLNEFVKLTTLWTTGPRIILIQYEFVVDFKPRTGLAWHLLSHRTRMRRAWSNIITTCRHGQWMPPLLMDTFLMKVASARPNVQRQTPVENKNLKGCLWKQRTHYR